MIRKTFAFRLYPNKKQEEKLVWTLDRCRELYNAGLQERREAWKYQQRNISVYEQKRDLPVIKNEIREEYKEINAQTLQNVLNRLDKAMQAFFRRVKKGEKPGYPRFQGKDRYNSLTYMQSGYKLYEKHILFSKVGKIRAKLHRSIEGDIKTATIKHEGNQWYVYFSCECANPIPLPVSKEIIGIDLGLTHLASLSDGTFIENPRYYRKAEKQLARRQQSLRRKKDKSHRRAKARLLVTKVQRKIQNQRYDFLHKQSRVLVNQYQIIVFEDLQIEKMVKNPKAKQDETGKHLPNGKSLKTGINKSISDAGWGMLIQLCTEKAEWAARTVVKVDPKYTSQICSQCGVVRKKTLKERWHSCECGAELDRDTNAAKNILNKYLSARIEPTPLLA